MILIVYNHYKQINIMYLKYYLEFFSVHKEVIMKRKLLYPHVLSY